MTSSLDCVHHWIIGDLGKSHCKKCLIKRKFDVVFRDERARWRESPHVKGVKPFPQRKGSHLSDETRDDDS